MGEEDCHVEKEMDNKRKSHVTDLMHSSRLMMNKVGGYKSEYSQVLAARWRTW